MLESIFGSKSLEKVLFFLLKNDRCYGQQLAKIFQQSVSTFQNSLDRLEGGGVIISILEGKTRIYQFNPRYPFLKEFQTFLEKAYSFLPEEMKERFYEPKIRKRPRKRGKPL